MKTLILLFSVLFTTMSFSQVPSYVPANGLVGWWPFNGNANDESGNGNNGTNNGATLTADRNGIANSAYSFDGVDDYIIGLSNSFPTNQRTVSVWFFSNNIGIGNLGRGVLGYGGNTCGQSWNMHLDNPGSPLGSDSYEVNTHCNVFSVTSSYGSLIPNGNWHNWVVTTDPSGTYFYLDGVIINSSNSFINNTVAINKNFVFGIFPNENGIGASINDPNNTVWNGMIDDIGIWNRALTPQEITNLYTSTVPVSCLPAYVPTSGLVGYWPFCGNANDESGNGNNGTNNGATLTIDRNGNVNSALSFDGIDDKIEVMSSSSLNFGVNPTFTISFWLNKTNLTSSGVICKAEPLNGYGWKGWNFYNDDFSTGYPCLNNDIFISQNDWKFILIIVENGNIYKYVNNQFLGQHTCQEIITNSISTSQNMYFGVDRDIANYFFGKLDDIGIWNRALTQQEITILYTSTVPPTAAILSGDATICAGASTNLSVAVTGGTAPYTVTVTDGINNYTATGASPVSIPVSPTATSTYTIVSVTGGGTGTGNTGTATVTVTAVPAQPTLACYETAVFNTTTCAWVISGPQAPQKMSYQAIIRNSNDSLLISTPVGMLISLVQGAPSGTVVFSETQTATTNANGLVSLQIGMGTAVSGTFACIDWAAGPYYVKTETDLSGGTNYTIISSNEILSVPYALFSANGPTGAQGPAGPQGPIGLTGATGPQGPIGLTGADGIPGTPGPQGIQGETGATGPQGVAGTNGTNGTFPPGTVAGEMNYWNGTAWVTVAPGISLPGNQVQTLGFCNGVPTWGPCPAVLPTVTTTAVLNITNASVSSGGAVTNDGGATLSAWGVCWSTSANPTLANSFLQNNVSSGVFSSLLTNLVENTTYYVRAYATNSTGTAYGNEQIFTTTNTSDVGSSFQGGIVAYILQPGDSGYDANVPHGLIAAPSDQGGSEWGCTSTTISGADGTAIGTGAQNTIDIMTDCSTAGIAARLCGDLVLNGYSDWYLPSKDELNQLYINRNTIGGFAYNWYWSSTELYSLNAWGQYFDGGSQGSFTKSNYLGSVRAVRAF